MIFINFNNYEIKTFIFNFYIRNQPNYLSFTNYSLKINIDFYIILYTQVHIIFLIKFYFFSSYFTFLIDFLSMF